MMTSVSFVFPCHNEEKAIASVLSGALENKRIMEKNKTACVEIIAVNDGSTDNSQKILDTYRDRIKVLSFPKQRGYGAALKAAFMEAKGEWIAFCDLDSTCDPRDLSRLLDLALRARRRTCRMRFAASQKQPHALGSPCRQSAFFRYPLAAFISLYP